MSFILIMVIAFYPVIQNNIINAENNTKTYSSSLNKIIKLSWNENEILIKLNDSSASNDLLSRLPITINFEDFNNTEKISYLDKKLNNTDKQEGFEPKVGDFALYTPWGNLSLFYKDFRYSKGLIPLGTVISGSELIKKMEGNIKIGLNTTPTSHINDDTVLIKGGTFEMGSIESEPEREVDEIRHKVTVNDFYISRTEVTQKEYQEITGNNPGEMFIAVVKLFYKAVMKTARKLQLYNVLANLSYKAVINFNRYYFLSAFINFFVNDDFIN